MEPKNPIIINGVDVSECKHIAYKNSLNPTCGNTCGCCRRRKNCYFKQFKRKEQECKRLKDELSTYGATGICETCTDKSVLQNDKYARILREIKMIAKENIRIADSEGLNGVYRRGLAKQILQKISEVTNE